MCPGHLCKSCRLLVGPSHIGSLSRFPIVCHSFHHPTVGVSSSLLNLAVSPIFLTPPCSPHTNLGLFACSSASTLKFNGNGGRHSTLCNLLCVPCACFILCCMPFSVMQMPTYISVSAHATCVSRCSLWYLPLVCRASVFFAWPISRFGLLEPSVRSKIICSRALCEVAKTTTSSANATLGKSHSSRGQPCFLCPIDVQGCQHCVHQNCEHQWAFGCSLLVGLNDLDVKCPSLMWRLCCSHRFEIQAKCCLSTPCSFIALGASSTCRKTFFTSNCAAGYGMSHALAFSGAIKMPSAPCSGRRSFAKLFFPMSSARGFSPAFALLSDMRLA